MPQETINEATARSEVVDQTPEFSAIITSYFEENSLPEFYRRLSSALESLGRTYEIIFVNDGSLDKTFDVMVGILEQDSHVYTVIDLFKNSGQLAAMTAGLTHARGAVFLFMDSDLQLDPEELPLLVAEYDLGRDVVSGCRRDRKDSSTRVIPSKLANVIMRRVSRTQFKDFGCTFKLYNAKLIRAFAFGPHKLFNTAAVISKAQHCAEVPVTHHPRRFGQSGWTFAKLWDFNMENIVRLFERPFQSLALISVVFAVLFGVRIAVDYLTPFRILPAVSSGLLLNVLVITFLITVGALCLIGEFTIRAFISSQKEPSYIIRRMVRR
ncbi:MAG: glycosyltransferase family 2 protein [Candidatus Hydrogenedentes bacterium]|nr:glycosyltransferase family 2 protein [Candidatus Hydrogenedentota bacterium]